jgi:hypothetical protein
LGFPLRTRTPHFVRIRLLCDAVHADLGGLNPDLQKLRRRGHTVILVRRLSNLWPCGFNESPDF